MTPTIERHVATHSQPVLKNIDLMVFQQFSQLLTAKVEVLAQGPERGLLIDFVKRAVLETQEQLLRNAAVAAAPNRLPASKLKVSEVLEQGWVQLSQASLYRAVDSKRFYCITPPGRSIGKEFPAWQFVQPVPELITPVLALFDSMPSSEIHAYWVSEADELNALSPAEVLAGLPFETRSTLHSSQTALLKLPAQERVRKVIAHAQWKLRSMAELIG